MNETKQTLISQFHKNSMEIVKVNLQEYKGKPYVDVRIFFLDNPQEPGSEVPTKKGICISIDLLPDLINGLRQAQEYLEKMRETSQEGRSPVRE